MFSTRAGLIVVTSVVVSLSALKFGKKIFTEVKTHEPTTHPMLEGLKFNPNSNNIRDLTLPGVGISSGKPKIIKPVPIRQ